MRLTVPAAPGPSCRDHSRGASSMSAGPRGAARPVCLPSLSRSAAQKRNDGAASAKPSKSETKPGRINNTAPAPPKCRRAPLPSTRRSCPCLAPPWPGAAAVRRKDPRAARSQDRRGSSECKRQWRRQSRSNERRAAKAASSAPSHSERYSRNRTGRRTRG